MVEDKWLMLGGIFGAIVLLALILSRREQTPPVAMVQATPTQVTEKVEYVPYPVYYPPATPPTPTPEPAPVFPSEGPTREESYDIAYNWMLNYFKTVDPGTVPADWSCRMEWVRTDTLRSPYSWRFTFDYLCDIPGGGTSVMERSVNVMNGVASIGG